MAKTAVALYQTLNDARHVVEELATSGYSRDDIQVIDQADGRNVTILREAGLPQEDALAYSEGLEHGAHLVMLTTSDDMVDAAVYIMESYNALNVHDQQAAWQIDNVIDNADGYSTSPVFDRDALHDGEDTVELPSVEEGIRYEEYQDEPGEVRAQADIEAQIAKEKITPRQEYVEESLRR